MNYFEKVKGYVQELGFDIKSEDAKEEIIVIEDETKGIMNLVIDCEDPILILEQLMFDLNKKVSTDSLMKLLKMNRNLIHGAFAIDDAGKRVLFRDTLQLENLDLNELEGSINALSLAMAENSADLIQIARS